MIGTSKDGTFPIGNGNYGGIFITGESEHNEVLDNLIGGNTTGIYVSSSDNNILANNKIGTNEIEGIELGNEKNGIYLSEGSQRNMIADNFISFNVWNGININGAQTIKNTIARNSISNNFKLGIFNESGGNNELTPPLINFYGENKITGNTGPGHIVEIFVDGSDEGRFYLGMTEANLQGDFTFTLLYPMSPAPNITATSTDA